MRPILLAAVVLTLATPALAVDGVMEINNAQAEAGGVTPGDTGRLPRHDRPARKLSADRKPLRVGHEPEHFSLASVTPSGRSGTGGRFTMKNELTAHWVG